MTGFVKVRFVGPAGATAGLIFPERVTRTQSMSQISRFFPITEARKMTGVQVSPAFPTPEQAFAFDFPEPR